MWTYSRVWQVMSHGQTWSQEARWQSARQFLFPAATLPDTHYQTLHNLPSGRVFHANVSNPLLSSQWLIRENCVIISKENKTRVVHIPSAWRNVIFHIVHCFLNLRVVACTKPGLLCSCKAAHCQSYFCNIPELMPARHLVTH